MEKKAIEYSLAAKKKDFETVKVTSSYDAVKFARKFYHDDILIYESSFIVLINHAGNVIGYAKISQGGVCNTLVDVRLIAKYAIDTLATSVIFIHNHPSGNLHPSNEDIKISERIKSCLSLLNIALWDSIIVSDKGYCSMSDEGLI